MPIESFPFLRVFAATLVAVAITAGLGRAARRRPHMAMATVAGGLLIWAIYLAEMLGRQLVLPRDILFVHLIFANLATLAFVAVVVTGVGLARAGDRASDTVRRRRHRWAIGTFVALVVLAAGTGTWMISQAVARG